MLDENQMIQPGRSGDDRDAALDTALAAADEDMLTAICNGLDLDRGLAQVARARADTAAPARIAGMTGTGSLGITVAALTRSEWVHVVPTGMWVVLAVLSVAALVVAGLWLILDYWRDRPGDRAPGGRRAGMGGAGVRRACPGLSWMVSTEPPAFAALAGGLEEAGLARPGSVKRDPARVAQTTIEHVGLGSRQDLGHDLAGR